MILSRLLRISVATLTLAIAAGSLATALPAWADPPGGKKEKHDRGGKGGDSHRGGGDSININFSFNDSDRVVIRDYYGHPPGGRCPPGLAKKNNGCMPPGQAKKWMMGHPLPRDVVFYDLPHELRIRMTAPPAGYKYVRVAGDILMIAAGTGMVAAAIQDLAMM
jgi:Ni/Co efflux regulator RcnB